MISQKDALYRAESILTTLQGLPARDVLQVLNAACTQVLANSNCAGLEQPLKPDSALLMNRKSRSKIERDLELRDC